jgi:hypothetical protein
LLASIALLLLIFAVHPMLAEEHWPLTAKVLSTQNVEDPHGSFHFAKVFDNASAAWSHRVAEHVFVEASDGNSYELVPQNAKDMLLPGTFQAKIEKRDMKVCEPKDNGNCREVKFTIVAAVPTVKAAESTTVAVGPTPKAPEPAPTPAAVAPSPAPSATALPPPASQASLSIDSTPTGADIEIDGAFVGNTPSTVAVAPGSHQIAVKKKDFTDWSKTLSVTGGTIHLNAELEQEPPKQ